MQRVALENLTDDVKTIRARMENVLSTVEGDLHLLVNSTHLQQYARQKGSDRGPHGDRLLEQAAEEFLAFSRTRGTYLQIRLISNSGDELLRVQTDDILASPQRFEIVPSSELRHDRESYYGLLTQTLERGQIAFSPVELRYREGKRVPAITFATPLYSPSARVGVLILNVSAQNLFKDLEVEQNPPVGEKEVVLVGSDGHYLYDSNERTNWNKLLASREENNLQNDYSPSVARTILSGNEGTVTEGTDDIISYAPLFPRSSGRMERGVSSDVTASLYIFERVPWKVITREARTSAFTFVGFLALFFASAVGLGLLATREFTRPISELRRGAEVISHGNYHHRLSVRTGDEIELLAGQFNVMAASVEQREQEIQEHRARLEDMVENRTRQLVEEKGKLQAILDNVPSAFVVLDKECRIQTASAAFTSVTGLKLEEVVGKDSREVFHAHGLCHVEYASALLAAGKTDSHIDRTLDALGVEKFLEHVTIPIVERNEITSVLQIITDITKRKQLEDHLIHSEKLMATGEMAAIIAHGFRNSLTSIKMILQLQSESKHLPGSKKKSLRVALDSIGRMESVVQELLNFARPSPLKYAVEDLNGLLEQSLALIGPRLKEHHITLRKRLDPHVPPLMLDGLQIREAIVNILVNALQAIEARPVGRRTGTLTVVTKRIVLPKSLRDFNSPSTSATDAEARRQTGREIFLPKGSLCVVVSITDSGRGISRDVLPRIFDPFFTTKTDGTGLGLPMVKRTLNAHGGVVVVRNAPSSGTIFELVLPLLDNPPEFSSHFYSLT